MDASSMGVRAKCRKLYHNRHATHATLLCDLPDPVLYHILSFLPMKDVVKTSILSKRWEFLWASVPNLELRERKFPERAVFMNFVDRAFILRDRSPIKAFSLQCEVSHDASRINTWITAAARGSLMELFVDLCSYYEELSFVLPCCILGCRTLSKLELGSLVIRTPPSLACLPNLKILRLDYVTFTDASLVKRLFSSPLLEELRIMQCRWKNLKTITIAAPGLVKLTIDDSDEDSEENVSNDREIQILAVSLKYFYYTGSLINRYCMCGSAMQLVEAVISIWESEDHENEKREPSGRNLLVLVNALSSVKSLTIAGLYLEGLENRIEVLDTLTQFNKLTKLKYGPLSPAGWDALLTFLRRSPRLRSLKLVHGSLVELRDEEFPEVPPSCCKQLKKIEMDDFFAFSGELSLVQALLKSADALEEMVIHCHPDMTYYEPLSEKLESLRKELMMFPRGLNCRVTIS